MSTGAKVWASAGLILVGILVFIYQRDAYYDREDQRIATEIMDSFVRDTPLHRQYFAADWLCQRQALATSKAPAYRFRGIDNLPLGGGNRVYFEFSNGERVAVNVTRDGAYSIRTIFLGRGSPRCAKR